ncbi:biliverdin-producing heme oxygenase [Zunongwangia endophytica]|uniref:Biliverdin-producing heme oxygenase n=1 Tax=Zunongwangia endophytica TaxID=1808945 RepID=A0ABV8H7M3_9FLAO|nr:biliverdin-producing heme oxygenase [Zunongwangia endophytica]MDN3593679.1 biliverdin-producing heme oxygenase [Zunongwangia endophytica]
MMLKTLREETSDLHKEIESDNAAGLIMDHSITLEGYKTLLLQNFLAYRVVEDEIKPFYSEFSTDKSERLAEDLEALDVEFESALSYFKDDFRCKDKIEALGASYVLEGSAMGGMLIAKELQNCQHLNMISKHHFFNGDRKNVEGWKQFMKKVNSEEFSEDQIKKATTKAQETFRFFGKVFNYNPQFSV